MTESRWLTARALAKAGDASGALGVLTDAIRRGELDAVQLERAGALARKLIDGEAKHVRRVALLGQCTTSWLTHTLLAIALGEGQQLCLYEGGYDNVEQEAHSPALAQFKPNVTVLLPWLRQPASSTVLAERMESWSALPRMLQSRLGTSIVQVGFDWVDPGPDGYHLATAPAGSISAIRRANQALREALPEGSYFVDLPAVSGDLGRRHFYDQRRYHWTKQPFSEAGVEWLARHLWSGIRALTTGPKKALVLDLDNTLWGGVVGELGALGVELGDSPQGEAHRALQQYAKALASRGILLAVASKNDAAEARGPFLSNREMQLSLQDFASFEANWDAKSASLARIAERLRLGADSFVFLDDSPTEREEIRQRARSVCVVDAPAEPAEYGRTLTRELWFETASVTQEDAARNEQYRAEASREQQRTAHTSLEDYLTSLELRAQVRDIGPDDIKRVAQLIGKTNQFNLTTPRYSHAELQALLQAERAFGLSVSLRDRFGDYGLILVVLGRPADEQTLEIDTFLMSCRAIARSVEEFAWGKVLDRAAQLGYERISASYRKTPKNSLVADLYPRLGLTLTRASEAEHRYVLMLKAAPRPVSFVRDAEPS
jgi:FkbH-like protein